MSGNRAVYGLCATCEAPLRIGVSGDFMECENGHREGEAGGEMSEGEIAETRFFAEWCKGEPRPEPLLWEKSIEANRGQPGTWQPIETAPNDRPIVAWSLIDGGPMAIEWSGRAWSLVVGVADYCGDPTVYPTHWAPPPLPTPPEGS